MGEKKLDTAKSLILCSYFLKENLKTILHYGNIQCIPSECSREKLLIIPFRWVLYWESIFREPNNNISVLRGARAMEKILSLKFWTYLIFQNMLLKMCKTLWEQCNAAQYILGNRIRWSLFTCAWKKNPFYYYEEEFFLFVSLSSCLYTHGKHL